MILAAGVDVAAGGGGGKAVFSSHLRILEEKSENYGRRDLNPGPKRL